MCNTLIFNDRDLAMYICLYFAMVQVGDYGAGSELIYAMMLWKQTYDTTTQDVIEKRILKWDTLYREVMHYDTNV